MCQWMNSLNKRTKGGTSKPKNLVLSIKPTEQGQYYRVRLLGFSPAPGSGSDRDDPFIERFVHQHWGVNAEKGYPVLEDEIVCPVTPHVHVEGNRYNACKICDLANKYFVSFKNSGWKDKAANKKNKEFGRKYQAIIPVFVVSDPVFQGNNNTFKVLIFNDKKFYTEFRKKIEKQMLAHPVFNGGAEAVDLVLHMSETPQIVNEGLPNEYTWKKREIDKIAFSTKPQARPEITKEACDAMQFDETYYTSSSPAEIDAFYKKYCTISNDDIPEDDEVPVYAATDSVDQPKSAVPVNVSNTNTVKPIAAEQDIDDLLSDSDDLPATNAPMNSTNVESKNDDIDADALLADLDL